MNSRRLCIYCMKSFSHEELTGEHVIPMSLGGPLELTKAACQECNNQSVNERVTFLSNDFLPTVMARVELDLRGHSGTQPKPPHFTRGFGVPAPPYASPGDGSASTQGCSVPCAPARPP
jgi:hypothetical protein